MPISHLPNNAPNLIFARRSKGYSLPDGMEEGIGVLVTYVHTDSAESPLVFFYIVATAIITAILPAPTGSAHSTPAL